MVTDLFIDGTFKSCSKHFFQLYTIHGGKNGHYLPLVFALLPSKSEQCYNKMWSLLINSCCERYLQLKPAVFHIDFERAMHNAITSCFPDTQIDCCRFHLGQKIQSLGLSKVYMDKSSEEGKWLSKFYGLSFLPPEYVEDIMSAAPNNNKCLQFADYVLSWMHYRFINLSTYNVGSSSRLDQQTHEQRTRIIPFQVKRSFLCQSPKYFPFC
jgi:hypothetical protein